MALSSPWGQLQSQAWETSASRGFGDIFLVWAGEFALGGLGAVSWALGTPSPRGLVGGGSGVEVRLGTELPGPHGLHSAPAVATRCSEDRLPQMSRDDMGR